MSSTQILLNAEEIANILNITKKALQKRVKRGTFPFPDRQTINRPGRPAYLWSPDKIRHYVPHDRRHILENTLALKVKNTNNRKSDRTKIKTLKELKLASKTLNDTGHKDLSDTLKFTASLINAIPGQEFKNLTLQALPKKPRTP